MSDGLLKIVQGEDREISVRIIDSETKLPLDLTGNTEISALFKNADGTFLTKTKTGTAITVVSAPGGKIKIALSDSETSLLAADERASFEILIDTGSLRRIVQMKKTLQIVPRLS